MFVAMMNGMNGADNPPPLQFNNVEATIWGFDMDWAWQWNDDWRLSGILNYVRGERNDIHDNLYRIAVGERLPGYGINTFARVTYRF